MTSSQLWRSGSLGRVATVDGQYRYLPALLATDPATLYQDIESTVEWTADLGTREADTTHYRTGSQSIKVTSPVGGTGRITKTIATTFPTSGLQMSFWFYLYSDPTNVQDVIVYLSSVSNFASFFSKSFTSGLHQGWNHFCIHQAEFGAGSGGESWSNQMIRLRFRVAAKAGQTVSASFDSMYTDLHRQGAIFLTFDDGFKSNYDAAYPVLRAHRIRATAYTITSYTDVDSDFCTSAQLRELNAAGWSIGNHTNSHTDLTTLTQAQQETEFTTAQGLLDGWGLTRASRHIAYPYGANNADTFLAMAAESMLTGRNTIDTYQHYLPWGDSYYINTTGVGASKSLATAKTYVDKAKAEGVVYGLLFHELVAASPVSAQWTISDFTALIEYIVAQRVPVVTINDLYTFQTQGTSIPSQR